jgi:hypothetical protein
LERPGVYQPRLAAALADYSTHLAESGKKAEALTAAQEGLDLRRKLATNLPAAFNSDLVKSLLGLADLFREQRSFEESLAVADEAVSVLRKLVDAPLDSTRSLLAKALNSQASSLDSLGRTKDAELVVEEAVEICRLQCVDGSDATSRHDLAISLTNLGSYNNSLERKEEALAAGEEAVKHFRELATKWPGSFHEDLAKSLHNLGRFRFDQDPIAASKEFREALHFFVEARNWTCVAWVLRDLGTVTNDVKVLSHALWLCLKTETDPDKALLCSESILGRVDVGTNALVAAFAMIVAQSTQEQLVQAYDLRRRATSMWQYALTQLGLRTDEDVHEFVRVRNFDQPGIVAQQLEAELLKLIGESWDFDPSLLQSWGSNATRLVQA